MSMKSKGTFAERELIHKLWERGWYSVRVAGSGSTSYPSPDIIGGNGIRRIVVECKSSAEPVKYIIKAQIEELVTFAKKLGCEPWVGFRYDSDWFFLSIDDLRDSGKSFMLSEEIVRMKGLSINQIAGEPLEQTPLKKIRIKKTKSKDQPQQIQNEF
jgi:holliday junction resolvase Hjr